MIDLKAVNHTNRELELMLLGRKPLAIFCDEIGFLPNEEIIPEAKFEQYVSQGKFIRSEVNYESGYHVELARNAVFKYVLFAVKGEEWRIPAFILMKKIAHQMSHHTEALERFECALLGYSEAESEAWCDAMFRVRK